MKKAGSTDSGAIMQALWSTEYEGVSGHIALDQENGDAIRNTAYVKECRYRDRYLEGSARRHHRLNL